MNDVVLIDSNRPIKNFSIITDIPGTGYVTFNDRVDSPPISETEEKYEHRFGDQSSSINRYDHHFQVTIPAGSTITEGFSVAEYSFGSFEVAGAFTGTVLNFEGKMRDSDSYEVVRDSTGAALTGVAIVTGTVFNMPSEIMHADMMRFVSESGQATETTIRVLLKG